MVLLLVIQLVILAAVAYFGWRIERDWKRWTSRFGAFLQPFRYKRRFGYRSWATRSFIVRTPVENVLRQLDELPETDWSPEDASTGSVSAMAFMMGLRKFPSGITVEWLDRQTADVRARQYSDWPPSMIDGSHLPLRQRQRLAEHLILHVEPTVEGMTSISYELERPMWVYVMVTAAVLLSAWLTWGILSFGWARSMQILHCILLWSSAGLAIVYAMRILRLQSVGLLDAIISTLGPLENRR